MHLMCYEATYVSSCTFNDLNCGAGGRQGREGHFIFYTNFDVENKNDNTLKA
jgi:hypothetical protein